jgi:CoA:oxalate CoA-transferase
MKQPLSGFRVLAIEGYYAGNVASLVFARFGAEVIKIETPSEGDIFRSVGPSVTANGRRRTAAELRGMINKKSVAIDLNKPDGIALFFDLVEKSDVVWTNLKPVSLKKLGINFRTLCERNSRIIYTTLSGFGHDDVVSSGPLGNMTAFDLIAQGLAGLQFRAESANDGPGYNGLPLGDYVTATQAALGTAMALLRREREGGAQRVDVAMMDAMLCLAELPLGILMFTGKTPPRGRSGTSAPYGSYRTKNGWVNIAVGGTPIWRRFCEAIERPELVDDPAFAESQERVSNFEQVESIVSSWTESLSTDEVVEILSRAVVPCAPVLDLPEVIEHPQVAAREMIVTVDDPVAGLQRVIGNPIKLNGMESAELRPPPDLGADTGNILQTVLGISGDRIRTLDRLGVVAAPTCRETS